MTAQPNIRALPEHLQKKAIEELNERPERVAEDLLTLKVWAANEPHLNIRLDDQLLVGFLRGCKYSLEKTKAKLDCFYTLKTKYSDFYTIPDVDDPSVLERLKYGVSVLLPNPLHETGARIMFIRAGNYPPDKYSFKDIIALSQAIQEIWSREDDYAAVNGYVVVMDLCRPTFVHFAQITPSVVKKVMLFAEQAMPLRHRATHFINVPAGFDKIFNMMKALMSEKQQERFYFHGNDLESLYAHVPQKYLPIELGGENGTLEEVNSRAIEFFMERRNYFIEDFKYRNKEELRVGQRPDFESLFGMEGSF
ncbi:alpha-tocopherol transfer protein-like [Eurosta solidaginis]|uniref:alpha-tocopherol transfer protein-like n=1 Tax=Eurosta solidaginis TaxID=178769 RepID=UPI003530B2BE